jgi:hypothetical protein
MVWAQCPDGYGGSLASGISLFATNPCGGVAAQSAALAGKAFSATDWGEAGAGGPGVLGWFYPDEADLHKLTGPTLPILPSPEATGRLRFLTLSYHFYSRLAALGWGRGMYPGLVERADVVGFDLYPLQELCGRASLDDVFLSQQELVRLAAGRPTFQWIEAATWSCPDRPVTAATVAAESWLAVAGGARGLGYLPNTWTPDVAAAIGTVSRYVAALAPALAAPDAAVTAGSGIRAASRRLNGASYVVAVNPSTSGVTASFTVPGLGGRPLGVLGEGRQVASSGDAFTDSFGPLGVHIYVAAP